jgi:DNA polymerase-3 subunit epsilon
MTWWQGPWCPYDVESTGVSVTDDRIVTAYIGRVGAGIQAEDHDWLINPAVDIPDEATAIHGITSQHAFEHGQPAPIAIEEIAQQLADALSEGIPVVGHNVVYDLSILHAECLRYGVATLQQRLGRPVLPVVDTLVLDKTVDKWRKGSRRLVDVAKNYGIDLAEIDAHGAKADALASARIAWRIATTNEGLRRLTLLELHDNQTAWAAEQAASFRDYLQKQGKPCDDVDGIWPCKPARTQVPA